jgi:uncharacterized membrane protein
MSFTNPLALVLLLAIPIVIYIGWPRHAYRRRRDGISLTLRVAIMALTALALAGTQISRAADKLAVIFLVDVSDSIGAEIQAAQIEYVRQSLHSMGPDDVSGVIVFGANSVPEHPVNAVRELPAIQSAPVKSSTDIAEAIRLGLALFPNDAAKRMVILSDGRPTVGDTDAAIRLAAAAGVEISYAAFTQEPGPEVQVTDLRVPTGVTAGQPFDLSLTIDAEEATSARVTIQASGEIVHQEVVNLRAGSNSYTLTLAGTDAGFKDFQAQVEPTSGDNFYQNNKLSAFSQVIGPPRVLLVSTSSTEGQYLIPALEEAGVTVDRAGPNDIPIGLAPLAQYDSVILANVPATDLSPQRMETLQSYVRDLGGGLIVIGGPNAYGPGGYFQTPLEETLPIEMQIRDQQRLPQLTIAYVIDRSGSMGVPGDGDIPNIELAKEAIIRSIDFLQPTDRAGVVSFDSVGYWIADIQPVYDRIALQRLVASLRASGGTDILAGMTLVARDLINDPSDRKHIILLTDGGANPRNLVELSGQLYDEAGITTSVISIGGSAPAFLNEMAVAGHGNFHGVTNVESIPTIFTLETVLATRSYILEEPFVPSLSTSSPIMEGINSAPQLLGYVAATPKQTAQVILRGPAPYNDPILTTWQYGLGRAVAFTSDATARWGAQWVTWENYIRFWSQAIHWTITEGASSNLEMRVLMEGEQARVMIDARDDAGQFLNGLNMQASVVDPTQSSSDGPLTLPLRQVAPGRYEALFTPQQEGAYFLGVSGQGTVNDQPFEVSQRAGWVMSYSSEYNILNRGVDLNLLRDMASLTNGRDMLEDPALPFTHNLIAQNARTPLWPWFLLFALLLLPFDIGVRRLIITLSDLRRARVAIFGRVPAMAEGPSERLSTLIGAKERGRQRAEDIGTPAETISTLRINRDKSRSEREIPPLEPAAPGERPRYEPIKQPHREEGANVASELLKRRKERK